MYLLSGENLTCGYNKIDILKNCNIGVNKGEITSIVGPNGAGKSTAMKAIFGLLPLRSGQIILDGEDITHLKPQERVLKGSQTIQDNVGAIEQIPNLKQDLERLRGLIAWQDNRSKQANTIIKRNF